MNCVNGAVLSSGPVCPALTTLWTATAGGVRLTDELHRPPYALWCTALPQAPGVRPRTRGVRLLSLAGPGRGRPGTGQRLGPDHIWVPRVGRRVLRPGALTPDPRPVDADALHHPASRHLGRLATGGPGYGLMNQPCQRFSGRPQSSRTPSTTSSKSCSSLAQVGSEVMSAAGSLLPPERCWVFPGRSPVPRVLSAVPDSRALMAPGKRASLSGEPGQPWPGDRA